MKKNWVVALTGLSGTGKSSLAKFFVQNGVPVVDCDEVAKDIHSNKRCQQQLCAAFGEDVVENGVVNKPLLAQRAFAAPDNLQKLTDITHPFIIEKILSDTNNHFQNGHNIVIVDGAVIIGHDFEKYCDKFIVILCDKNRQYQRLMKRDSITLQQAQNRVAKQTKLEVLLEKADYIVYNNTTIEDLENQGEYILKSLKNL